MRATDKRNELTPEAENAVRLQDLITDKMALEFNSYIPPGRYLVLSSKRFIATMSMEEITRLAMFQALDLRGLRTTLVGNVAKKRQVLVADSIPADCTCAWPNIEESPRYKKMILDPAK